MALNTFVITNTVVWCTPPGGPTQDWLGHVAELEIDPIELIREEYPGMGLFGTPEHVMGAEPMMATFTWTSVNRETAPAIFNWRDTTRLQVRANLDRFGQTGKSEERPYVVTMEGVWGTMPFGSFQAREFAEWESEFNIHRIKLEIEGRMQVDFDVYSNKWLTGSYGDLLEVFRQNLGV